MDTWDAGISERWKIASVKWKRKRKSYMTNTRDKAIGSSQIISSSLIVTRMPQCSAEIRRVRFVTSACVIGSGGGERRFTLCQSICRFRRLMYLVLWNKKYSFSSKFMRSMLPRYIMAAVRSPHALPSLLSEGWDMRRSRVLHTCQIQEHVHRLFPYKHRSTNMT